MVYQHVYHWMLVFFIVLFNEDSSLIIGFRFIGNLLRELNGIFICIGLRLKMEWYRDLLSGGVRYVIFGGMLGLKRRLEILAVFVSNFFTLLLKFYIIYNILLNILK